MPGRKIKMSYLQKLKEILDQDFEKATEADEISSIQTKRDLLTEALAEKQTLAEKHVKLKDDYIKAVKQTIAPGFKPEGTPAEVKSDADIYRE